MLKIFMQLTCTVIFLSSTITASAHNKVVVIPLFGDEAHTSKIIFVTQQAYNGNLGGPEGADEKCQDEADNLPDSKVKGKLFKAWISGGLATDLTSNGRIFNRFTLPYKLVDGSLVSDDFEDLVKPAAIKTAIHVSATGTSYPITVNPIKVWTGIEFNGADAPSNRTCNSWTSAESDTSGRAGGIHTTNPNWTTYIDSSCETTYRLYCFEQ